MMELKVVELKLVVADNLIPDFVYLGVVALLSPHLSFVAAVK